MLIVFLDLALRCFGIDADMQLRAARIAQEKQREEVALREVQFVVEEMERLKESLSAAVSTLFPALCF